MRIILSLGSTQLLQSPRLISIHLFQRLITEGIVDISVLLAVRLTIGPELRDLLSDGNCFRIKGAVGIVGNKDITMSVSLTDSGFGQGRCSP
jgi:hypothetical protein